MYPSPLTRWFPVLVWMGVIFWFSSIPELKSTLPTFADVILRKLAHMTEFAILAVLTARAGDFRSERAAIAAMLALGIGYAITDEVHQSFVAGREAAVLDVGVDALGVLIGMGVRALVLQRKKR